MFKHTQTDIVFFFSSATNFQATLRTNGHLNQLTAFEWGTVVVAVAYGTAVHASLACKNILITSFHVSVCNSGSYFVKKHVAAL